MIDLILHWIDNTATAIIAVAVCYVLALYIIKAILWLRGKQ